MAWQNYSQRRGGGQDTRHAQGGRTEYTALDCTALDCTALDCTALDCTALDCMPHCHANENAPLPLGSATIQGGIC